MCLYITGFLRVASVTAGLSECVDDGSLSVVVLFSSVCVPVLFSVVGYSVVVKFCNVVVVNDDDGGVLCSDVVVDVARVEVVVGDDVVVDEAALSDVVVVVGTVSVVVKAGKEVLLDVVVDSVGVVVVDAEIDTLAVAGEEEPGTVVFDVVEDVVDEVAEFPSPEKSPTTNIHATIPLTQFMIEGYKDMLGF